MYHSIISITQLDRLQCNVMPGRTIYEQLGMAVSEEQRSLYSQRVEEITPNVRYCAYNMKDMPSDLSELMKLRSSAHGDEMLASKIDVRGSCDCSVV